MRPLSRCYELNSFELDSRNEMVIMLREKVIKIWEYDRTNKETSPMERSLIDVIFKAISVTKKWYYIVTE